MKKALFVFGWSLGMAFTYIAVVVLSPILAAIVVWDKWQSLDLSNVTFPDFKAAKKTPKV